MENNSYRTYIDSVTETTIEKYFDRGMNKELELEKVFFYNSSR